MEVHDTQEHHQQPSTPWSTESSERVDDWNVRMARLALNDQFSDIIITCQGHQWRAHRFVLYLHSQYFHDVLQGQPHEHPLSHGSTQDPLAMEFMLRYLYCSHDDDELQHFLNEWHAEKGEEAVGLNMLLRIFSVAKAYRVDGLDKFAISTFYTVAQAWWEYDEFAAAIERAYTITEGDSESTLRQAIVATVMDFKEELLDKKYLYPAFAQVHDSNQEFEYDVACAIEKDRLERSAVVNASEFTLPFR